VADDREGRDGFDAAVDALYGLPPGDFVAAREERAKAARAAGDRDLAARIHALRRPSVGAWLVNLLARERPEVLHQLIELGGELREAQENLRGGDLRALTGQRQQVVSALVDEARELARGAGEKASDETAYEVERTLLAALADPQVGAAVATGTLVRPLEYSGFGPVGSADVVGRGGRPRGKAPGGPPEALSPETPSRAGPPRSVRNGDRPAPARPRSAADDAVAAARRRRLRAEAEATLREAQSVQRQVARRARGAAERAAEAESRRQEADAEIGRLTRELHTAQSVAAAAQDTERDARLLAAAADAEAEEAAEREAEARRRLAELPE
jgi:hypothetical protein